MPFEAGNISTATVGESEPMKFIIDGRTYDTATSVVTAYSRGESEDSFTHVVRRFNETLYRTAKGNFFVHAHTTTKTGKGKPVVEDYAWALTAQKAMDWVIRDRAVVVDDTGLPMPDEA